MRSFLLRGRLPALAAALGIAFALVVVNPACAGPDSPVGLWKNIDDKTGEAKALIRIEQVDGELRGVIEQVLTPGRADAVCDQCEGELRGKPIRGMRILEGLRKAGDWWEGGTILDPNNGKSYRSQLRTVDGGAKLEVRGYIGMPILGRTQTWVRQP
jgi:uncharacterized protein (DUF2147 family)